MPLEMKANCESCQATTSLEAEAYICSFECSFCLPCTRDRFNYVCPNCGGELVRRPKRMKTRA